MATEHETSGRGDLEPTVSAAGVTVRFMTLQHPQQQASPFLVGIGNIHATNETVVTPVDVLNRVGYMQGLIGQHRNRLQFGS